MNESGLARASAGHRLACHSCGEEIDDWCERRRYGFWDAETQTYEQHGGIEASYCRDCWQDDYGRTNGAHYWPDSSEELYGVLDASDGNLAAILTWWTGRPAIRVVDGDPQAAITKPTHGGEKPDGTPILQFKCKRIDDFDRDEFDDVAAIPDDRNLVLLRDPARTSFVGVDDDLEAETR